MKDNIRTYEDTFRYRNCWMGFAVICMMLFHTTLPCRIFFISKLRGYFIGSVDIFVFASGIGSYYSLSGNNDAVQFWKRRIIKLAPVYLLFMLVWIPSQIYLRHMSLIALIGNVLGIEGFAEPNDTINWYIRFLFVSYMLAPLLASFTKKANTAKFLLLLFISLLITVPFLKGNVNLILVTRIPIFIIGMWFAKNGKREIKTAELLALAAISLAGIILIYLIYKYVDYTLFEYGMYWYPFILVTPGLCICMSYVIRWMKNRTLSAWVEKALSVLGTVTFELYLVNLLVFQVGEYCMDNLGMKMTWGFVGLQYLAIVLITVLLKKTSKLFTPFIKRLLSE